MAATASPISPYKHLRDIVIQSYFGQASFTPNEDDELAFICPACQKPTARSDLEIQSIIPWGSGADREHWNFVPLCTRPQKGDEDWGCSELLERSGEHAIDWMLSNHPNQLHEMSIRLQLAYGDLFHMPAGKVVCLRFLDKVYRHGCRRYRMHYQQEGPKCNISGEDERGNNCQKDQVDGATTTIVYSDLPSRDGEWTRKGVGFKSDILDIAQCFASKTDTNVVVELEEARRRQSYLRYNGEEGSITITTTATTASSTEGTSCSPLSPPKEVNHPVEFLFSQHIVECPHPHNIRERDLLGNPKTEVAQKHHTPYGTRKMSSMREQRIATTMQRVVSLYDEALDSARRALETPPKPRYHTGNKI